MATTIQNIEHPKKPRARDTSGNNNHGEIYSGRGLEFDGVTDYLQVPASAETDFAEGVPYTWSTWVNFAGFDTWFLGLNRSHPNVMAITSGQLAFREAGANAAYYYLSSTKLNLNTWYRLVVTADASNNMRLYINGVLDHTLSEGDSPYSGSGTFGVGGSNLGTDFQILRIGSGYSNNAYGIEGMMSNFQVWDKAWTATDVTYDYLNPESLALNASGTALTEGNLKLWYPMQDGHRGQQSYILDGANTGLGEEMVFNGDFSDGDTGWVKAATTSATQELTADGLRMYSGTAGDNSNRMSDTASTMSGKEGVYYVLKLTATDFVGLTTGSIRLDGIYDSDNLILFTEATTEVVFKAYRDFTHFQFYAGGHSDYYTVNNVSLKPINDKHHATTVFHGDDLWDLADNSVANWTAVAGSSEEVINGTTDGVKLIFGGTATNVNGSNIELKDTTTNTLTEDLTVGRTYKLSGKFATDVAGATNAPRPAVVTNIDNYASTATVPATNLVLNPGFETAVGAGADIWANWTEAAGSGTLANATSGMHNGDDCASLTTVSGNLCNILQQITVVANTTYLASYWSKNANASAAGDARHRVLNTSDGDSSIVAAVNSGSETADWVQTYFQFTTPTGCTSIKYGVISPSGNYEVLVDDFMLTAFLDREITFTATHATDNTFNHFNCEYAAANEMIEQGSNANNSTFASGIGNWVVTDASGSNATIAHSTDAGGTITINPTTDDEVEGMLLPVSNLTDLEVGRSYTVLVRMKSTSGTPGVEVRLGNDAATAQNISDSATTYAFVVSPIVDTGALRVQTDSTDDINIIVYSCEVYPHCNLYVDDLSVKEVGVASGWTDADQQLHIPQPALQSYNELAWFDGTIASNGYVDLDSAITTSGNSWSLSFWVFHDDNGQAFDFIAGNGTNQIITLTRAGTDFLSYRDSSDAYHTISDAAIPESEWVHITITATANTSITAYVNGVAQTTNSDMTNTTLLLKRFMRGFSVNLYHVFGTINEISYYSDVLTAAEVLDLFNDGKAKSALEASGSAGLVGYWRNNGLSEWKDLKGSNDGNTSAGVVETILIPEGVDTTRDSQGFLMNKKRSTSSLNFPSRPQSSTEVPDFGDLDFGTGDFSMECWVQYGFINNSTFGAGTSGLNVVLSTGSASSANSEGISLLSTSTDFKFRIGDGDKEDSLDIDPDPLTVGNWYHIVVTREGTALIAYVDGDANNNMTITSGINVSRSEPLRIGNDRLESRTYKWPIDAVKFYNAALSASEVLQNYNATKRDHTN